MDGIEVRRIRHMEGPGREVPIIGLTANVMVSEQERYLAAGMCLRLSLSASLSQPVSAAGG